MDCLLDLFSKPFSQLVGGMSYHFLYDNYPNPLNLKKWFFSTFRKGIIENYLFPYNQKILTIWCRLLP